MISAITVAVAADTPSAVTLDAEFVQRRRAAIVREMAE